MFLGDCMIYLLKGQEKLLLEMQLTKIIEENNICEADCVKFDATEQPISDLIELANSQSMFFDKQVVIVNNPFFLTGENPRLPFKNDYTELETYIENPNPETVIIFFANYDKLDSRKNLVKKLEKNSVIFEAKKVTGQKYNDTLEKAIAKRKLNFTPEAFELFVQLIPEDLEKAVNELDKIKLQGIGEVDKEVIEKSISQSIEKDVFELTKAIGTRDKTKILKVYQDIMLQKNMEIALISIIGGHLVLFKNIQEGLSNRLTSDQIAKEYGKNPFVVKMNINTAKMIKNEVVLELIEELTNLDYMIKTGKIDKEVGLDLFILKLINKI